MIVDSHCHLDYPGLAEDEAGVIARAHSAGRRSHGAHRRQARRLAGRHRAGGASARGVLRGRHPPARGRQGGPRRARPRWSSWRRTRRWSRSARAASTISTTTPRATARLASFRTHIRAARATGLPLIVHTRDADDDTMALLEAEMARGAVHRRHPLLQLEPPARRARGRDRLLSRHRRHPHLQEVRGAARDRPRHAAGPAAAGDRRALSGAGAHAAAGPTSRPTRRTSPRCWPKCGVCRWPRSKRHHR